MFYFLDFTVKEEPGDNRDELHPSDLVLATHNISASDEIVLNVSSADEVIDSIKSEPIDLEAEDVESGIAEVPTVIIPWPAFVPVASHPELAGARRKRKTAAAAVVTAGGSSSPVIIAGEKRSRRRLEDVTSQYSEEDMDENQVERGGGGGTVVVYFILSYCVCIILFSIQYRYIRSLYLPKIRIFSAGITKPTQKGTVVCGFCLWKTGLGAGKICTESASIEITFNGTFSF